jgi:hypothetical protein
MNTLIPVRDWFWHQHFCSFQYRTDPMPDSPTFRHLKTEYIHPACPCYKQWTGIHPQVHTAGGEMGIPFTSILLAVERDTPCTSILISVEKRDTSLQPVCPYCWQWKRITLKVHTGGGKGYKGLDPK